jgi:two-component system NtrC family sensor kinase
MVQPAAQQQSTAIGQPPEEAGSSRDRYRRLFKVVALSTCIVSIAPLIILAVLNYHQYKRAYRADLIHPISLLTSNTKRSLEFFLSQRRSALNMIINDKSFDELCDQQRLEEIFSNLKTSFGGGFVDLGLIDDSGNQCSYVGPFQLEGINYADQQWFREVSLRGVYVSNVFKGFRKVPHFVIAVKHETGPRTYHILRATVDTEMLNDQILHLSARPSSDAFLISRKGVLQSPSRIYGDVLDRFPLEVPPYSVKVEVIEQLDERGRPLILGYAYIESTSFIFMLINRPEAIMGNWLNLRSELIIFTAVSALLILAVIFWGSNYMVSRLRAADARRAAVFHNMEYTNKMATIGRLAAGVAHEINNPLAIINEKAGLLNDLVHMAGEHPLNDKLRSIVGSIIKSVERCSDITHRLLGFARQREARTEMINLESLLKEVLGFLGKSALHRDIEVNFNIPGDLPAIESDRRQLQQIFLNIINNAFAAIDDGGRIDIGMTAIDEGSVGVSITDNGSGISEENMKHIFEPFFTTKKGYGTGLGLSITFSMVDKIGGSIDVQSVEGEETTFTVRLPVVGENA